MSSQSQVDKVRTVSATLNEKNFVMCRLRNCLFSVIQYTWFVNFSRVLKTGDGEILLDFSKNLINDDVFKLLLDLVNNVFAVILMKQFARSDCNLYFQFVNSVFVSAKHKFLLLLNF